jgi:arsenate reductase (thioredoxin)
VLFLCTGISARSIIAKVLITHWGRGRLHGFGPGRFPKEQAHPMALQILTSLHLPTGGLRSKSWHEFAAPDSARTDFVFAVCDQTASEVCRVWPGQSA